MKQEETEEMTMGNKVVVPREPTIEEAIMAQSLIDDVLRELYLADYHHFTIPTSLRKIYLFESAPAQGK